MLQRVLEATGFIGNISRLHRDSFSTLQIIIKYNNRTKNLFILYHLQDNDVVQLDHEQHGGGVVNSRVDDHLESLSSWSSEQLEEW